MEILLFHLSRQCKQQNQGHLIFTDFQENRLIMLEEEFENELDCVKDEFDKER